MYRFFEYESKYFARLLEISLAFNYVLSAEMVQAEGFDAEKFEKQERKYLRKNVKDKDCHFLVCAKGKELVGYTFIGRSDMEKQKGYIHELYVRPKHRKRGIANRLLHDALSWLRTQGCTQIELQVDIDNRKAKRLYKKLGFLKQRTKFQTFALILEDKC